jgi:hypothetical protein
MRRGCGGVAVAVHANDRVEIISRDAAAGARGKSQELLE